MSIDEICLSAIARPSDDLVRHIDETIRGAIQATADSILDETRIEQIANAARTGATYSAITYEVRSLADEAKAKAQPFFARMSDAVAEAFVDAVGEIIREKLANILKLPPA